MKFETAISCRLVLHLVIHFLVGSVALCLSACGLVSPAEVTRLGLSASRMGPRMGGSSSGFVVLPHGKAGPTQAGPKEAEGGSMRQGKQGAAWGLLYLHVCGVFGAWDDLGS